ncbi:hypothetical protein BHE74_00046863 [Ensete ventricosum]|nr:hypothetical protein BHE74_00046863 [Ensete ventricosum]
MILRRRQCLFPQYDRNRATSLVVGPGEEEEADERLDLRLRQKKQRLLYFVGFLLLARTHYQTPSPSLASSVIRSPWLLSPVLLL